MLIKLIQCIIIILVMSEWLGVHLMICFKCINVHEIIY